jgi:hypothetical protein
MLQPWGIRNGAAKTADQVGRRLLWARRLKLAFGIDIAVCRACDGAARIIACIEDPVVIKKILIHLDKKDV